jgi:hypothetical protein
MSDCPQKKENLKGCNCTYSSCSRKGKCCECLAYHRDNGEFPACFFSKEAERTYDRSFENLKNDRK